MTSLLLAAVLATTDPMLDVVYSKPAPETELKMDIYRPEKAIRQPSPCVVVIHGGAWMSGKRQDMTAFCTELAKRGVVAATVQYRLAPKFKWPAMLDDVQTAVRYLRANAAKYEIDPNRIGAMGASAGGHLSLFLGARETRDPKPTEFASTSSRVRAVFNIFGPVDMLNDFPSTLDGLYLIVLGKQRVDAAEEIRSASPYYCLDASMCPVFTIHGDQDPLVPVKQANRLDEKLKELKRPHELRIIAGMAHEVPLKDAAKMKNFNDGLDWLIKELNR